MKKTIWRLLSIFVVTMVAVTMSSCSDNDIEGGGLILHYPTISDIGPSMTYTIAAPSFDGAQPSSFAISSLTLEDEVVENTSFVINAETGSISIENTNNLAIGLYKLTITCIAGGGAHTFADLVTVNMLSATPAEIEITPAVLNIPFDGIKDSKLTAKVKLVGESVSINIYSIIQVEGKEFFTISDKGVIGVNSKFSGQFTPGIHNITLKLTTAAGGDAIYENAMQISITSAPIELTYEPAISSIEFNNAFTSSTPLLGGSLDEVVYAIKAITPATDKIIINKETGVLSAVENSELPVGSDYSIDITVTNKYGTKDFVTAYELSIVDFIEPIVANKFVYTDLETVQGGAFIAVKGSDFVGGEVSFELTELPAALVNQVTIDILTGTVSANKGNTIALGDYDVKVKAMNVKGEAVATLKLSVVGNPYYFSKITFGNNLGLDVTKHANQYRFDNKRDFVAIMKGITPTTDANEGVVLTWSIDVKIPQKWSEDTRDPADPDDPKSPLNYPCEGMTIDATTGVINSDGFESNKIGVAFVTATAGKGQQGEVSVTTPLFFAFSAVVEQVTINYTPFVLQINPQRGGRSAQPTITGVADMSKLLMDYRRDFEFYNINGLESHQDGRPNTTSTSVVPFLKSMWDKYKGDHNLTGLSYGSKAPMSYYLNYPGYTGKLDRGTKDTNNTLIYIDQTTHEVVINPNKWVTGGAYANGALSGQMIFQTNGDASKINSGTTMDLVWVWFDEKF